LEFGSLSRYEIYFEPAGVTPILGTKNRERVVGALIRSKGGGALVLLPPVQWDEDALSYTRGDNSYWRKEGITLGNRLSSALLGAAVALRKAGKQSPPPEWVLSPDYALAAEVAAKTTLEKIDKEAKALAGRRATAELELESSRVLYGLLYETGPALENALLRALSLLGFQASGLKENDSEFDAVFVAREGRFLGEAEGKDSKAINIDKITQLERNLQEDFAREEVTQYAKGVLFGNAFRFQAPQERPAFFTEKCQSAATRLKVAMIRTPDLFVVARYLSAHPTPDFAAACRSAILATEGTVVVFPAPPVADGA